MLYYIFFFSLCITMLFCFVDYKGILSSKILGIYIFFIMAYVTTNADMVAYKIMYDYIDNIKKIGYTDPGFGLLMYVGRILNLDYSGFIVFLTIVGFVLTLITLKKLSVCPAIMLVVYFVFLFPTYTVQIRSYIAEPVLFILMLDLVNSERINYKRFFLLLAIATIFHATSIFFILLLAALLIRNKIKLLFLVTIAMLMIPASSIILRYVPIPMIQQKIQYYFLARERVSRGALALVFLYIVLLSILFFIMKRTKDLEWRNKLDKLLRINIIGLVPCAMVILFNSNFYRMVRVIFFVDMIVLGNKYFAVRRVDVTKRLILGTMFVAFFLGQELLTRTIYNLAIDNSILGPFLEMI